MRKRLTVVLSALLLSACMVGPDYERPAIETPKDWRFPTASLANAANTLWWRQFQDPVLNRLIQVALQENQDLKIATARIDQFLGQYAVVRSQLFPQLFGSAAGTKTSNSLKTNPPAVRGDRETNLYQGLLDLSYEIDLWGRLRRQTEAAQAQLFASEEGRRAVILTLVASVASAYTQLLSLDRQLALAQSTTDTRAEFFRVIDLRFKAGIVSALEVSQAKSDYEEAASTVPDYQRAIAVQEDLLSILLGRNPGPIVRDRRLEQLALPAVPAGLPSSLLERRPDILQAEQNLIAANAQIGVARAAYFPTLSLTGTLGTVSATLSDLFTGPAKVWQYGVNSTLPIFTAGNLAGNVQIAEAQQRQLLFEYQRVIQQAFREVNDALINTQKYKEQLQVLARQVEALQNYRRLAGLRYDNGYVSLLEVLDADRRLFQGEINQTQSQAQLYISLINLYQAMGGGWVSQADAMTAGQTAAPPTQNPPWW
ncbi:MAG: efflux transporter outer membrane subunit [Candidatus Competibacteraceae bacterium]